MNPEEEIRFIRLQKVLHMTSIPKSTLMAMIADGKFPQPVHVGTRSRAWVESEVKEWQKDVMNKR